MDGVRQSFDGRGIVSKVLGKLMTNLGPYAAVEILTVKPPMTVCTKSRFDWHCTTFAPISRDVIR